MSDKEFITDEDLPLEYHFAKLDSAPPTQGETLFQEACDTFERNFILRALEKSDWNVTATAQLPRPCRSRTLKHKMRGSICAISPGSSALELAGQPIHWPRRPTD